MAVTYNLKGTSNSSFQVGKQGAGTLKIGALDSTGASGSVASITGHLVPSANVSYDLGTSSLMWRDVYVGPGSLYINGKKVLEDDSGSITLSTSVDQSLHIKTHGTGQTTMQSAAGLNFTTTSTGDITFTTSSGQVNLDGDVIVNASKSISSSNANPITFADPISVSGNSSMTNLTVTGDLTVQGSTTAIDSTTIAITNSFTFEGSTADNFETTLAVSDPTADRTILLPDASGDIVLTDTTDTLSNKTLASPTFSGTVSGTLALANTTTGDSLLITTTENSSTAGPVVALKRNSTSPADADYIGQVKFAGENDADQEVAYAKITGKILDASDGSEDGMLEYSFIKGGSQNISARFRGDALQLLNGTNLYVGAGGSIQFEGATADAHETTLTTADATADRTITLPDATGTVSLIDETETLTNKTLTAPVLTNPSVSGSVTGDVAFDTDTLFVDSTNNRVGIRTTSPAYALNIAGGSQAKLAFSGAGTQSIYFGDSATPFAGYINYNHSTDELRVNSIGTININGSYNLPSTDGSANQFIKTDGSGQLSFATVASSVVEDTTPQLGGDLDVNGNKIVSTSNGDVEIEPNGTGNAKITSTGALILPVGTTAQRPSTPVVGMFRFNSTTDRFEGYNGASWVILGSVLPTNEATDYGATTETAISNHDYGAITDADSIIIDYKTIT